MFCTFLSLSAKIRKKISILSNNPLKESTYKMYHHKTYHKFTTKLIKTNYQTIKLIKLQNLSTNKTYQPTKHIKLKTY